MVFNKDERASSSKLANEEWLNVAVISSSIYADPGTAYSLMLRAISQADNFNVYIESTDNKGKLFALYEKWGFKKVDEKNGFKNSEGTTLMIYQNDKVKAETKISMPILKGVDVDASKKRDSFKVSDFSGADKMIALNTLINTTVFDTESLKTMYKRLEFTEEQAKKYFKIAISKLRKNDRRKGMEFEY